MDRSGFPGAALTPEADDLVTAVAFLEYTLTALSRLSAGRSGEVLFSREIHEMIPGSTVRGALASAWLNGDAPEGATSQRFHDLFERSLVVRPAIPEHMHLSAMSVRWCKYPLPADGTDQSFCAGTDDAAAYVDEQPPKTCPNCGGGLESGRGYGWQSGTRTGPPTVAVIRTALNTDGVAKDEQLFTRRALERDMILRGSLLVLDPDRFSAELVWLRIRRELRVGGQRSVLGLAEWTASDTSAPPGHPIPDHAVLRFTSPAILVDEHGAPTLDPGPELRRLCPDAVLDHGSWLRPVRVGGWHAASGLPKPEDWAVEAGSTFVVNGLPTDASPRLVLGLGLRRLEGYGAVELLDPAALPRFDRLDGHAHDAVPVPAAADGDTGGLALPGEPVTVAEAEAPVDMAAEPEEDQPPEILRGLWIAVGRDRWRGLLQPLGAGVLKVQLAQSAGFSGSVLDAKRDEVIRMPWARDLGGEARRELRELLEMTDLAAVRRAIETERGVVR
jgi:CRISPR-associated protein Csx10